MKAIVIGASAGGLYALETIISKITPGLKVPVLIVQHSSSSGEHLLPTLLQEKTGLPVVEAEDKMETLPAHFYIAPPNYHLLVEESGCVSLSTDAKVNHSRPAIDVLFESAARVYREGLVGIILTGANSDGSAGMIAIEEYGGLTIVQAPETAEFPYMPQAAINTGKIKLILSLESIAGHINDLNNLE